MTRVLYLISLAAVVGAIVLGVFADDERVAAQDTRRQNEALLAELQPLDQEVAAIRRVEPAPLRYSADAMSEFFSRTVEAGEVLGAGVRIEPREMGLGTTNLAFNDFKYGVKVCQVNLSAGLEVSGAAAILAMFEEELAELPVTVRKTTARMMGGTVSVSMEVDVFGR